MKRTKRLRLRRTGSESLYATNEGIVVSKHRSIRQQRPPQLVPGSTQWKYSNPRSNWSNVLVITQFYIQSSISIPPMSSRIALRIPSKPEVQLQSHSDKTGDRYGLMTSTSLSARTAWATSHVVPRKVHGTWDGEVATIGFPGYVSCLERVVNQALTDAVCLGHWRPPLSVAGWWHRNRA